MMNFTTRLEFSWWISLQVGSFHDEFHYKWGAFIIFTTKGSFHNEFYYKGELSWWISLQWKSLCRKFYSPTWSKTALVCGKVHYCSNWYNFVKSMKWKCRKMWLITTIFSWMNWIYYSGQFTIFSCEVPGNKWGQVFIFSSKYTTLNAWRWNKMLWQNLKPCPIHAHPRSIFCVIQPTLAVAVFIFHDYVNTCSCSWASGRVEAYWHATNNVVLTK